jgi:DNA-binding MarR family transcriptional regulator
MAPPLDGTDSAEIADELRTVVARLVRRLRAGYTVPAHQFSVLRTIERSGPQTTSNLAAIEIVRPQSMAHTVRQLDAAGFITRAPDASDGRQTLIGLSDVGRTALEEQRRDVTGWLAEAIDDHLTADERGRLADAVGLLGRLVDG